MIGLRLGSFLYQAPEQRKGKKVTIKADIYSLGLLINEIFTGNRYGNIESIIQGLPERTSRIISQIASLVEKMMKEEEEEEDE